MEGEPAVKASATPVKGAKAKKGRKPKAVGVKKAKSAASHPKYLDMVVSAVTELNERGGTSRQGIIKYIQANYDVGKDAKLFNTHLKLALKRGVATGVLKHAKGQGASGSFKLSGSSESAPQATTKRTKAAAAKIARKPASPKAKKAVVPAPKTKSPAAKPKKVAAKKAKPAAAKKSPAKKTAPASKKAKSPKPKASPKKSPIKKAKSPKRKTPKRGKK